MNPKARQELVGIAALLVGFFLGLTLLPVPLTGSWGRAMGAALWQLFGVGAIVVPILGVGWALAAFERLGALSWGRAAVLGAGLILLVPYGIAVGIGPVFPPDYTSWTRSERLVGLFPAFLANGVEGAIGTSRLQSAESSRMRRHPSLLPRPASPRFGSPSPTRLRGPPPRHLPGP